MRHKRVRAARRSARMNFSTIVQKLTDEQRIKLLAALQKDYVGQVAIRLDEGHKQLANMMRSAAFDLGRLHGRLQQMKLIEKIREKPSVLRGFHGTTVYAADNVKNNIVYGRPEPFTISRNPWDWLGSGVYFWLEAPHRAADRAYWWYRLLRRQQPWLPNLFDLEHYPPPRGHRSHFAVIETRIRLFPEMSINLLDITWMEQLKKFTHLFEIQVKAKLEPARTLGQSNYNVTKRIETIKSNKDLLRRVVRQAEKMESGPMRTRDCQLFNDFISTFPLQCIIAGFREGEQVIPGVNVWDKDHVQVNVIDQSIIDFENVTIHDAADFMTPEQISKYAR